MKTSSASAKIETLPWAKRYLETYMTTSTPQAQALLSHFLPLQFGHILACSQEIQSSVLHRIYSSQPTTHLQH